VALPGDPQFPAGWPTELATLERLAIAEALRLESGNRTRAARRLGISLRTLRNKLRAFRSAAAAGGQ
jgi:DNA-binding NtrC family response regulator